MVGVPTTLACPGYSYVPTETAPVVQRLLDAGALFVGKTSLDQFATGLNGTRTPHPVPRSVYGAGLISGGSSLGSALAVALGPGAVRRRHGYRGLRPRPCRDERHRRVQALPRADQHGWAGARLQVAGLHQPDGRLGRRHGPGVRPGRRKGRRRPVVAGPRPAPPRGTDPAHRPAGRSELEFFGDDDTFSAHLALRGRLAQHGEIVGVSLAPFLAAGSLLYQGPWVAERLVEFDGFLTEHADDDPSRGPRHLRERPPLHRSRCVRGPAAAAGTQGRGEPALADDGRPDRTHDRYDVHRRRGACRPGRHQHRARALHPLRQPPGPCGRRRSGRHHRRRPTRERTAARRCPDRQRRARAGRSPPGRTARPICEPMPSPIRSASSNPPSTVEEHLDDHRSDRRAVPVPVGRAPTALLSSTCSATSCCPAASESRWATLSQLQKSCRPSSSSCRTRGPPDPGDPHP